MAIIKLVEGRGSTLLKFTLNFLNFLKSFLRRTTISSLSNLALAGTVPSDCKFWSTVLSEAKLSNALQWIAMLVECCVKREAAEQEAIGKMR
jgi:hypothetical protein